MTARAARPIFPLAALVFVAISIYACTTGDDDDDDDCRDVVIDPLSDCEAVCNDNTCAIARECDDYVNIGAPENCVEECFRGCEKGCIPSGAVECLDEFTDCDALVACLDPQFRL